MMKILILILFLLIPSISISDPIIQSKQYLVMNLDTQEVLLKKESNTRRSIASITKLMTAIVTVEARNTYGYVIISKEDVDKLKHTSSRLKIGSKLDKRLALKLALQSSENRAANALLRSYPGGYSKGVEAMNRKAGMLGMTNTRFFDATGLNPNNRSTAEDLCKLIRYALHIPLVRQYSVSRNERYNKLTFINSNPIVRGGSFPVKVQKTGFINEAKYCVALVTDIGGNNIAMIFLNSPTSYSRFEDARRVYRYLSPQLRRSPTKPAI